MVGNQSVILFRTHFPLNLLENASFPTKLPIFVCILTCALVYTLCVCYTLMHAHIIKVYRYGTETAPTC